MTTEVAIIGDRFMRSRVYQASLRRICGTGIESRRFDLPWPDEPMNSGIEGIKEYQGDPDRVVEFTGLAQVLVTQLAPCLNRLSLPCRS